MQLRLFVLMALRGATYGAAGPFISILALRAGLPLWLLGPLAALGALITLGAAPWWGRTGDMQGRRRTFAAAMACAIPVLLAFDLPSLPGLLVAWAAWSFLTSAYAPLGDSLTLDRLGGRRDLFSRVRVGASIGWVVSTAVSGAVVSWTDLGWAAPGILGASLAAITTLFLAVSLGGELVVGRGVAHPRTLAVREAARAIGPQAGRAPDAPADPPPDMRGDEPLPTLREQIVRHRYFLAGQVGIFAAINAPLVFVAPRVSEIGGSGFDIGIAIAAGSLTEVPAFWLMPVVLAALGSRRTFLLGAVLTAAAGLASALVPTPELVILVRLLSGAGYAWALIPSVAAIAAAGGPRERASLTGLHFGANAGGTLLVALLGIPLVAATNQTVLILSVAALLSPVGAWVALRGWPVPYESRSGVAPVPSRAVLEEAEEVVEVLVQPS